MPDICKADSASAPDLDIGPFQQNQKLITKNAGGDTNGFRLQGAGATNDTNHTFRPGTCCTSSW